MDLSSFIWGVIAGMSLIWIVYSIKDKFKKKKELEETQTESAEKDLADEFAEKEEDETINSEIGEVKDE